MPQHSSAAVLKANARKTPRKVSAYAFHVVPDSHFHTKRDVALGETALIWGTNDSGYLCIASKPGQRRRICSTGPYDRITRSKEAIYIQTSCANSSYNRLSSDLSPSVFSLCDISPFRSFSFRSFAFMLSSCTSVSLATLSSNARDQKLRSFLPDHLYCIPETLAAFIDIIRPVLCRAKKKIDYAVNKYVALRRIIISILN